MDFGKLIGQAARSIWRYKFLLALGFVVAMINESSSSFVESLISQQMQRRFPQYSSGFGSVSTGDAFAPRILRQILLFAGSNGTAGWIITGIAIFALLIVLGLTLVVAN